MPTTVSLGAKWASATDVLTRLDKMKAVHQQHTSLLSSMDGRIRQRRTEMERSLGDLPDAERAAVASKATASFRREMLKSSDAERTSLLKDAIDLSDQIRTVGEHYRSPTQMMMRESLGSERRSRIGQQIETSGPMELASLAAYAASMKDVELAAALCSRNSTIKSAQRSFSSSELADALFGDQFREVSTALTEIAVLAQQVVNSDRAFTTGRGDPAARITTALMRGEQPSAAEF